MKNGVRNVQVDAPAGRPSVQSVLRCEDIVVRVGHFHLGPVSFDARSAQTIALLGANGAGKTTLLGAVLGTLVWESGGVTVLGETTTRKDVRWLRHVGFVPDDPEQLLPELTAWEYWELVARIRGRTPDVTATYVERAGRLAEHLLFRPSRHDLIRGYSHGMRKKTQLVAAMLHAPRLLILDEPRNGLDPAGIAALEALLHTHRDQGGAALVATHDLHWAARVSSSAVILSDGTVAGVGPIEDLCQIGEDVESMFFRLSGVPDPGVPEWREAGHAR